MPTIPLRPHEQASPQLLALRSIEAKYEILEKFGEGGMGAIYKVRHLLLNEVRVIKLMRQQLAEEPGLKARFVREAKSAIKLRHPNIAHLYDFTVDEDGNAFIVMEFIDGMTLEDVLRLHGPPPLGLGLEIARQSLKALGYLHGKGYVHRDISPDNLMLTADAEGQPLVKLIDLGIAKVRDAPGESQLTQAGDFLGKIRYSSPEQFGADGATLVDARGDLYSFGVVLYELLTGRYPIQGKDSSSIIAGHLFRPPIDFAVADPAAKVPAGLRQVVLRALAKHPDERFADAEELSRALGVWRAPSDVAAEDLERVLRRETAAAAATISLRRRRTGRWLAGAAAAALALLVIGAVTGHAPESSAPEGAPQAVATVQRSEAPQTVPVPWGTLVVDALPWAEVVRIEDAAGKPVDLFSNRYTPMALAVPAGQYQVVLKGPGAAGERRVPATVGAGPGESRPVFVEFHRTSAEEYFRDLGF